MSDTIEDIVAEMRAMPECIIMDASAKFVLSKYADRIEAAWKRERKERGYMYEYVVEYQDCGKWIVYKDGLTQSDARKLSSERWGFPHRIVRREVGEWEVVE